MKLLRNRALRAAAAIAAAGCAVSCLGSSPNVTFYTMKGVAGSPVAGAPAGLAVGVGPIRVPRYLDRPELVRRPDESSSRLEVDDFSRWAGGFASNVLSALGENLGVDLDTEKVIVYPTEVPFALAYRVAVDFRAFEGVSGDALVLRANWLIRAIGSENGPWTGQSTIRRAIAGSGNEALVAAHNEALGLLAEAIAKRIAELEQAGVRRSAAGDPPSD